ncbi:MAG: hypothetical protein KAZ88_10200, partial [Acidimicrobiia bacterium]|nr:hypothetical protein [Acidimicrobiia bacterium]
SERVERVFPGVRIHQRKKELTRFAVVSAVPGEARAGWFAVGRLQVCSTIRRRLAFVTGDACFGRAR